MGLVCTLVDAWGDATLRLSVCWSLGELTSGDNEGNQSLKLKPARTESWHMAVGGKSSLVLYDRCNGSIPYLCLSGSLVVESCYDVPIATWAKGEIR